MGLRFGALEIFLWRRHGQTANEPLHGVTKTEQWLGEGNRRARGFNSFLKSGWVWQIAPLSFCQSSGSVLEEYLSVSAVPLSARAVGAQQNLVPEARSLESRQAVRRSSSLATVVGCHCMPPRRT